MDVIKGQIYEMGDNVSSDVIIHAQYALLSTDEDLVEHVFDALGDEVKDKLKGKSVIVAGENFGCGSGREAAPRALKLYGIKAIIGESVARAFFRNAINMGLLTIECPGIKSHSLGNIIEISLKDSIMTTETGEEIPFNELPQIVLDILEADGLLNLEKRRTLEERGG